MRPSVSPPRRSARPSEKSMPETATGQTRIRLPTELHSALKVEAERQGVSLNTLIVALLAGGISWRQN